jgi:hypothetical protein
LGDPGHVEEPGRLMTGRPGAVQCALIEIGRKLSLIRIWSSSGPVC